MSDVDLHNYKRQLEAQIRLLNKDNIISDENKQIGLKFKDYLLSGGITAGKIGRYMLDIRKFAKMLNKTFSDANKEDIRRVIGDLEQTSLAPESKKSFKIMIRKLYRFIRDIDEKGVYPEEVKWISIAIPKNHTKLPEELLTNKEIEAIIRNCDNLRDKTLVAVLAESGCRISEIGLMKIKHISFEEYGARLTVNGKTGMRKILVVSSAPYLQNWINEHPKNDNPEKYVWYNPQAEFLSYSRIVAIIKNAAKKAGIKKRVYAHLFRHSRATELASVMSEASMKHYLGWSQSSKMCGIYIHMNGKETDDAILRASGIEVKKEYQKPVIEPKKCIKCNTINEATNRFCKLCGTVLDKEIAQGILKSDSERQQADDIMNKLLTDPDILNLIKKKLNY